MLSIEVMIKKPNYWNDLFQICKKDYSLILKLNFKTLEEIGMLQQQNEIQEFSKKVEKYYILEKKYNELLENMKNIKIPTVIYKKNYILGPIDDVFQLLDDCINSLIFMKMSPFIKPILKRTNDLELRLLLFQETLDNAIHCQRFWKYVEPIFSSEDIKHKMPREHLKFVQVDRSFLSNMQLF
jgi:dynein heavy chain